MNRNERFRAHMFSTAVTLWVVGVGGLISYVVPHWWNILVSLVVGAIEGWLVFWWMFRRAR